MGLQAPQVTEERLQKAVSVCTKAGAELVYLFGSQVSGEVWGESDVDLAVLLGPGVSRDRYGGIRVELIGELMSVFGSNKVDVVILNEAPPLLTYEGVIRSGRLLFEKDKLARIRFEVRAFQEYMDTAPLREVQSRYLKHAIRTRAVEFEREQARKPAGSGRRDPTPKSLKLSGAMDSLANRKAERYRLSATTSVPPKCHHLDAT
jgi:hypothetical protein